MFYFSVLFGLYSNDNGSAIIKEDFYKLVQGNENGFIPDQISQLFHEVWSAFTFYTYFFGIVEISYVLIITEGFS